MADLLALAKWCNDLPARIELAASAAAVAAVKAMDNDLVEVTPVDTTEAVSNWQVGINEAPYFGLPAIFPGVHGSTAPESRDAAIQHVNRVLELKEPGEKVYLSNLVPYIEDLNNGSSSQAPAGFVDRAIIIGEQSVRSFQFKVAA